MAEDLVKMLKPKVSVFSSAIKNNCIHGDDVCLGGKITSIFDMSMLSKKDSNIIQVDVDDGVGNASLLFLTNIYDDLVSDEDIGVDDIILVKGRVYDPMKKLKTDKENWPSILCWSLKKI